MLFYNDAYNPFTGPVPLCCCCLTCRRYSLKLCKLSGYHILKGLKAAMLAPAVKKVKEITK